MTVYAIYQLGSRTCVFPPIFKNSLFAVTVISFELDTSHSRELTSSVFESFFGTSVCWMLPRASRIRSDVISEYSILAQASLTLPNPSHFLRQQLRVCCQELSDKASYTRQHSTAWNQVPSSRQISFWLSYTFPLLLYFGCKTLIVVSEYLTDTLTVTPTSQ